MIEQRSPVICTMHVYQEQQQMLVSLSGGMRLYNCEATKQRLISLMEEPLKTIYLHLGQLQELDSAGLGVLVGVHITARKKKIDFFLIAATDYQIRLFDVTRLTSVFSLMSGVEAEEIWLKLARAEFEKKLDPQ